MRFGDSTRLHVIGFLCLAFAASVVSLDTTKAQQQITCSHDALSEAAASLALSRARTPSSAAPTSAEIRRALERSGSSLPSARALVAPRHTSEHAMLTRLPQQEAGFVCGIAENANEQVIIAGFEHGTLRRIGEAENSAGELVATWAEHVTSPYLVLIFSSGQSAAFALPEDGVFPLDEVDGTEHDRLMRAQLMGTLSSGPRPIANWGSPSLPPMPAGHSVADRVSRLRDQSGASSLRPNRLLSEAAARHAQNVCRSGRASHVIRQWPEDRMRQLGLRARHLGEVVARAASTSDALEALAQSPSHRLALVDRRFTDVGHASVRRGDTSCVVVFLAAWPQAIGR